MGILLFNPFSRTSSDFFHQVVCQLCSQLSLQKNEEKALRPRSAARHNMFYQCRPLFKKLQQQWAPLLLQCRIFQRLYWRDRKHTEPKQRAIQCAPNCCNKLQRSRSCGYCTENFTAVRVTHFIVTVTVWSNISIKRLIWWFPLALVLIRLHSLFLLA